jgi:DNA-binding HxlR family transcriptional regulator
MGAPPRRKVAIATLAPPGECCPYFHEGVELIGKRWTGAIVYVLMEGGSMRFSEIGGAVPNLSDRLLSERMKELEARGIVERQVHEGSPARVEYSLTSMGRELAPAMSELREWALRWL